MVVRSGAQEAVVSGNCHSNAPLIDNLVLTSVVPTGIPGPAPAPEQFALRQNIPNPFNPTTTIRFDLATAAAVTLRIYDVSGRLVRTLVDRPMPQLVIRSHGMA